VPGNDIRRPRVTVRMRETYDQAVGSGAARLGCAVGSFPSHRLTPSLRGHSLAIRRAAGINPSQTLSRALERATATNRRSFIGIASGYRRPIVVVHQHCWRSRAKSLYQATPPRSGSGGL